MPNLQELEAKRNKAREAAAAHETQKTAEALRERAVELKLSVRALAPGSEARKAAAAELAKVAAERDALDAKRFAPLTAAQAELTKARRAARSEQCAEQAAKLEGKSLEELAARRAELEQSKRALKAEHRAVVTAISAKESETELNALVAGLDPLTRKKLADQLAK